MSGKGSAPRPIPNRERYESEWDRIFTRVIQNPVERSIEIMHPMPAQTGEVEGGSKEAVGSG